MALEHADDWTFTLQHLEPRNFLARQVLMAFAFEHGRLQQELANKSLEVEYQQKVISTLEIERFWSSYPPC